MNTTVVKSGETGLGSLLPVMGMKARLDALLREKRLYAWGSFSLSDPFRAMDRIIS